MRCLFVFMLSITWLSLFSQVNQDRIDSLIGSKTPNFIMETLAGEKFDLSSHKGKVIVVNFWSLSCGACFKEILDFNRIVEERRDQDFILVSLMDNTKKEIDEWIIPDSNNYYRLKRISFRNDEINYEVIPNAMDVMKEYGYSRGAPLTFFC